jgi:hypothetical protein
MGKELETLLAAKPAQDPKEAKEHGKRLQKLLAEVERYEKRADWHAKRQAFLNKLGVHRWPERIRKRWKKARQQRKRATAKKNTFAFIRRVRKATFILKFNQFAARRRAAARKL